MNEPEIAAAPTATAASKKPGSLGLYFGAVAIVGAYASLFIPALAGQPVNPQFGYGSMFWSGLFFYFLWKRRGRSGRNGAIIGALVGLLAFMAAAFVSGFVRASAGH